MGDANRTRLSFKKESTWGTAPATGTFQQLRMTGESFGFNIENVTSEELRSDRQVSDLVQTGAEIGGGFNFELSYGSFDDLMSAALFSTWSSAFTMVEATIAATASGFTDSADGFVTAGVKAGMWVKLDGFSAGSIDGTYKVTAVTAGTITTEVAPADTEAAGATVTLRNDGMLRNGVLEQSYTFAREHLDMSPVVYLLFKGCEVSQMQLSAEANSILTGSFEFMGGTSSVATGVGGFTSGTVADTTTTDVMNAVSNVGTIREGGSAVAAALVQGVEITVGNALRGRQVIGTLGNASLGAGRVNVNGTINAYFLSKALYEKYVNGTESSFSFKVTKDSKSYVFTLHRIKYTEDAVNAEGIDTDVMEALGFQAIRHATYGCTIQIDKFAA